MLVTTAVPPRALLPSTLAAGDFPGGPPVALCIHQVLLFLPAQHQAERERKEETEPETAGEALIEDVQHPTPPLGGQLDQELALFLAFERLARTPAGPPAHAG